MFLGELNRRANAVFADGAGAVLSSITGFGEVQAFS